MIEDVLPHLSSAQKASLEAALAKADVALQEVLSALPLEGFGEDADGMADDEASVTATRAPAQWDALNVQAVEALRQDQPEQALDGYVQLVEHHPLSAQHLFGFALCLQQMGQLEQAAGYFSLSYALEPSHGACAFRLGECLLALGHVPEAQDALRAAIELDAVPGADPVVRELAQHLLDQIL